MSFFNSIAANSLTSIVKLLLDSSYKISLSRAKRKAQQANREKALIVKWKHIYGVTEIPWSLEYDFLKYRSPSYIRNTKHAFQTYYQTLFGVDKTPKTVTTPSDDHFYRSIAHNGNSFYMHETDQPDVYFFDTSQLMTVEVFPGYYFEVRGLEVNNKTKEVVIVSRHNNRIKKGDPNYEQAKIHAMSSMSYFNAGIGHSWVHFQFPCVVSAIVFNEIPRDSVLYQILYIHTRFTMRINHQALRIQRASDNKNTRNKRLNALQSFPLTGNTFVENNQARTVDFYKVDGEFSAPPLLDERIPYQRFVGTYYRAVLQFIEDLGDRLEMDLVDRLFTEVDKYIPADLSRFDRKQLLATFIWQVAVLHSSDHHTYYSLFRNYSCPMIGHRLEEGEPDKPEALFEPTNIAKFENFADVFVRFSYDESFPNNLDHLTYHFTDPQLQSVENKFVANLKSLESSFEKEGLGLVPLRQMAQSICF